MPLYPLYALLFADHGLSDAAISALFALWSVTTLVLEVPSGAWADVTSRRRMLAASGALAAAAFALWVLVPAHVGVRRWASCSGASAPRWAPARSRR